LLLRHAEVRAGAEDRHALVRQLLGILGIELLRPVDAFGGVPLARLSLLIEAQERGTPVLVFPAEGRRELLLHVPVGGRDGNGVAVGGGHRGPPRVRAKAPMARANTLERNPLSRGKLARIPPRSAGTVTRIVEGALELLNRPDGGAVTTNH